MKILKLLNNKSFSILFFFLIFFSQNLSAEDDPVDIWNLEEMSKKEILSDNDKTQEENINKSKIFAIEPTNYAFKKLTKNLNLNKNLKKNISLNQLFISKTNKPKKVWSSWNFDSDNNKHKQHLGTLHSIKKKSYISLNNFIKLKKIKKVDFIKLDVDGHELDVLKSGEKFLKDKKPVIFIEIAPYLYPEFGYKCSKLITYIKKLKYSFYSEELKKIADIDNYVKKITYGGSENFYLMKNYKT